MRKEVSCEEDNLSSNGSDTKKKNLVSLIISFSNDKRCQRKKEKRFTESIFCFS